MTETMPQFTLMRPSTVEDAVNALQTKAGAMLSAGGTDLFVRIRKQLAEPQTLIDLTSIEELNGIAQTKEGLRIGAGVTLNAIENSDLLNRDYTALAQAAATVAGPSHRQVATIGGNVCLDTRCVYFNQSHWWRKSNDFCLKYAGDTCHVAPSGNRCRAAFSGDLAPALMVHDAEIEIAGPTGRRRVPLDDFYVEDGAAHLGLMPDEIVTALHMPKSARASGYGKIRVRKAIDFPLAGVAVAREGHGNDSRLKVAVTGTNSRPFLIDISGLSTASAEDHAYFAALEKHIQKAVSPQRTTMIAPHYRRLSVAALTARLARGL
ncbi:4-hydroxybenzoyl-CoA reductase subunit beta [Sulfitobacter sp. JB4-11]|uniref:4-hydroxybenzoyl-CoA reductase subunit beta n=1 Tax=Sulfitobacter rhodophyticola TaxID=3238304 RepID=UPI003D81667D